jgi:hypothetical protein
MNANLLTGPQLAADGSQPVARSGRAGELIIQQLHGRYYEQAFRQNMWAVANQAAVSTTAALATTWTGLAVSNPAGSGVNLVFNKFVCAQFAAGVAGAIGLMTGTGAAAGSLVPRNRMVGGPSSKAVASAGATIATPVLELVFAQVGSVATTAYGLTPGLSVDLEGSLIVPPGFFVATYTTAATTTALLFGLQWEEVPV